MKFGELVISQKLVSGGGLNTSRALYESNTGIMLAIDDNPENPKEGYVSILDLTKLIDAGVFDIGSTGEVNQQRPMLKDDYIASVIADFDYDTINNTSRGTAWMRGLNEFIKQLYNG